MIEPGSASIERLVAEAERLLGPRVGRDVPLGPMCTYRVGGDAAVALIVESDHDLDLAADLLADNPVPVLVIGRGSNLLVSDRGFPGLVIVLGEPFAEIEVDPDGATITAGGAALLPVVARRTAAAGLTGFEWAVGVPGSIGGAVRMNAGGHGSDVAANLDHVEIYDLRARQRIIRPADSLALAYRQSAVAAHEVVLSATFALESGDAERSQAEISEIVRWRRANQPGGQNAGSVFTNPPGDSAGRMIDAAGLKGFRIGTAEVSPKHANFIQADPGGSADDVHAVITEIIRQIEALHGIELHPENLLIGFDAEGAP
ncbi:MAG: UDP-N-acetylmuramate dehydrogenase [Actinomycetota bacterium]